MMVGGRRLVIIRRIIVFAMVIPPGRDRYKEIVVAQFFFHLPQRVAAMRIYDPEFPDLHVFPFWAPVLAALERARRPAPDCPRTLALLERSIHVDLSPLCDEQDLDEIALAFEKVAHGILA